MAGTILALPAAGCGAEGFDSSNLELRRWNGQCIDEEGPPAIHVVALELSASERGEDLLEARIEAAWTVAAKAADCEARLIIALLESGKVVVLHDSELDSELSTETARDIEVVKTANTIIDDFKADLANRLAAAPPEHSDPGAIFRLLDEELTRLPDVELEVTIVSDGLTSTPAVDLNRPFADDDVDVLAQAIAPEVDLGGRASLEWIGMGATADPTGPPQEWLDRLVAVWRAACQSRGVLNCHISTTQKG